MITRRSAFMGLLGLLAAPAIIRTPGILMPIKSPRLPQITFHGGPVVWLPVGPISGWIITDHSHLPLAVFPSPESRILIPARGICEIPLDSPRKNGR